MDVRHIRFKANCIHVMLSSAQEEVKVALSSCSTEAIVLFLFPKTFTRTSWRSLMQVIHLSHCTHRAVYKAVFLQEILSARTGGCGPCNLIASFAVVPPFDTLRLRRQNGV
jgi:hypothetical protein